MIDTDAFCKLGTADLLTDAIGVLGVDIGECGRLAALPYMLRRGRLRRAFGDDNSHGWVLGKTFCIVGVIVAGQAAVDGLAEQRDQVVADVAAGTAFLEIVGGYGGKVQGVIQFSECQQSGVGGDGGTM